MLLHTQLSDWYAITRYEVETKGGKTVTHHYKSLAHALQTVYPEFEWDASRFRSGSRNSWRELNQDIEGALERVERHLGILKVFSCYKVCCENVLNSTHQCQPEDWQGVTLTDLKELGFPSTVSRAKLAQLLHAKYPDHDWTNFKLQTRKTQQRHLEGIVSALFKVNICNVHSPLADKFLHHKGYRDHQERKEASKPDSSRNRTVFRTRRIYPIVTPCL